MDSSNSWVILKSQSKTIFCDDSRFFTIVCQDRDRDLFVTELLLNSLFGFWLFSVEELYKKWLN